MFHIREGDVEGTDIGGLKVAFIIDTPKVMTEGNWRIGVFVDEQATEEQADKLVQVFSGSSADRWPGSPRSSARCSASNAREIDIRDDGLRHSVRIGDAIDFEIEDIVPFGVETGEPVRFPGCSIPSASDLTMAEAKRSRINAFGIQYEGKTGLSTSEFSWAARAVDRLRARTR